MRRWKKTVGWIIGTLMLLLIVGVVGGFFYLRSQSFQQFAIGKIVDEANQATGGRTQIGSVDFSLSTLTAHLHNIIVRGTERPSDPPLLQADELTVGLKIRSVFKHQIDLSELVISHPMVHLQVDAQGKNNIPQAPPSPSSSNTSVFDLAVGHFALTNGEVQYNDKKIPVDAELYNLQSDISFERLAKRYSGTLSYGNGRLQYANYAPLPHNFTAKFSATPSAASLQSAVMSIGSSSVSLHADVTNYSNPVFAGDYDIHIHTQDFAAMSPDAKPAGDIQLSGKMHYANSNGQPFLQAVSLDGQLGSRGLAVSSSSGNLEINSLKGSYNLQNGVLRARGIEADTLGGRISAEADVQHLDLTPNTAVRASLHGISLHALQQVAQRSHGKQSVVVAGLLDGTVNASWTGASDHLRAQSDLNVRAGAKGSGGGSTIPVNGSIHALYDGSNNVLTLRQTVINIPSSTLTANGQISQHSSLQLHAQVNDLHQLVALASAFGSTQSAPPLVAGSATLNATVQGSMQKPQVTGQIHAQNLVLQGSEWKSADLSLAANPSEIRISNGTLASAKSGRATFDAAVALRNWAYSSDSQIRANLSLQHMAVADLQHLANVQYPVSGDLSANVSMHGSQLDPAGSGTITIANARAYDEPIQSFDVKFQATNGTLTSTINVALDAGSATSSLTYTPRTKAYKVRLDAPSIVLEKLHTLEAKNAGMKGTLSMSANGEGTVDDPRLDATLELPKLEVRDKSIAGLKAQINVANKRANLVLDSQVAQASVRARGQVELTGDYQVDASIDTGNIPLEGLAATFTTTVPEGFKGATELHATLKGPLKDKTRIEAHLSIPILNASYQQFQIAAASPIRADFVNSIVTVQPAEIKGTGTTLHVQGTVPVAGNSSATLVAKGSIDTRILRIFLADLHSSGTVSLDVRATGTPQDPTVQGQIGMHDVALNTPDAPVAVDKLNGTLDLSNDRVQISNMSAQVGGGQLSIGGSVVYRPSLQFNVALQGNSIRLRYPDGLRTVFDSNLAFTGNLQASSLNGRVLVDSLSFTPDFDISTFADQFASNEATPSQPGFADTVNLAIGVQSKENLSATSSQVSMEGRMNLRVGGTAANPVITGRTDLTAGELFYRNVRYQLQRGVITFDDPNQTHPNLNVSVGAKVQEYDVTINLRGPLDKLTSSYTSEPPLATADIINLVAFGKTTSESAASSSSQSTDSMLAQSAIGGGISSGVQKLAGISSLQIDPTLGGNNQNLSARIALQQRVTKNFLFTFSTDVSQPGDEIVQGEYQINKRWSVSMSRDQLGGVSVDGRFHTQF